MSGDVQLTLVESLEEGEAFLRWLGERRPVLAIDTETEGLDWWRHAVRTIQFGDGKAGWCIPAEWWKGLARDALKQYRGEIVLHNAKFDAHALASANIMLPWERVHDTMVMSHITNPAGSHALKKLSNKFLGAGSDKMEQELDLTMTKNKWTWATIPIEVPEYWEYACFDTILTARLYEKLKPLTAPYAGVYDVERTVLQILWQMERKGIRIDLEYVRRQKFEWIARIQQLTKWCQDEYHVSNPSSNKQVYTRLLADGVHLTQFTPSGQPKLTEDILTELTHPLAQGVLEIRKLTKLCSTYLDALEDLVHGDRVHCGIRQVGARTGRMSITRPALQTLPRGRAIRDAFLGSEDHNLILSDYSGIEMRLLASYAQEEAMILAYRQGVDIHTYTAQKITGRETVSKEERRTAKGGGFSKIYGAGIPTFARTTGMTIHEAEAFMLAYDREFPGVRRFQALVTNIIKERGQDTGEGWVTSPLGRRHPVEVDKAYKACNYLIQGTAADVLKQALVRCSLAGLGSYLVLPVHDELVFDVPKEESEEVMKIVLEEMEDHTSFAVPLTCEAKIVSRWGDAYADEG